MQILNLLKLPFAFVNEFQKNKNKLFLLGIFLSFVITSFSQIPSVCIGGTEQLTGVNPNASNPWTSSNTSIATVTSTGLVTGVSNGTCNITFTNASGAIFTNSVTVLNVMSSITLTSSIASTNQVVTGTSPFTNITYNINQYGHIVLDSGSFPAGIYGSFNNGIYTISGTPLETGTFTYTLSALCGTCGFDGVTVSGTITSQVASICLSNSQQLTIVGTPNTINPWISNSPSIVTVSPSGTVTGIATGTATILYTDNNSNTILYTVYVNNPVAINPITGVKTICVGAYSILSDLTLGGTWSSSNTSIATVSSNGTVSGISPGSCAISYTATPNGCATTVTTPFTVVAAGSPATLALTSAYGTDHQTLHVNHFSGDTIFYDTLIPIVYTMGGGATDIHLIPGISSLPSGVTGVYLNGVFTISGVPYKIVVNGSVPLPYVYNYSVTTSGGIHCYNYGLSPGACYAPGDGIIGDPPQPPDNPIKDGDITLDVPCLGAIAGFLPTGCEFMNYTASLSVTGSPTGVTVSGLPTGLMYNYSNGSINITGTPFYAGSYVITIHSNGGLCMPANFTGVIVIEHSSPIILVSNYGTDNQIICTNSTLTSISYTANGAFLMLSGSLPTGVTSLFNGYDLIISGTPTQSGTFNYSISSVSPCIIDVNGVITVNATPVLQNITGSTTLCVNSTTALFNSTSGGVWSCTPSSIASISTSGIVTGNASGSAIVTYTKTNGTCSASVTINITVIAPVTIVVTGPQQVCVGSSINLVSSATNVNWSTSNPSIATISSSGIVTGISSGNVTINCGGGTTNCPTTTAYAITVSEPIIIMITGPTNVCVGNTINLFASEPQVISDLVGIWSTSNSAIATINSSGNLIGVSEGVVTVYFTVASGVCTSVQSYIVTVNAPPLLNAILGNDELCVGSTVLLTNSTPGGIWSSSNSGVSSIDSFGNVIAISSGSSVITYSVNNDGCISEVISDIDVYDTLTPQFSAAPILCKGSHNYALPLISENSPSVTGTWSPVFSTNGVGTTVYTFTPDTSYGPCVNTTTMSVTVIPYPIASFTYVITGNSVQFTNTTSNSAGASFYWSFGNSTSSTLENPNCTYSWNSNNTVFLTVNNGCEDSETHQIQIGINGINENELNDINLYPNPFSNEFSISLQDEEASEIIVYDLAGKIVFESNYYSKDIKINLETLVNGQYLLKINQANKTAVKMITKK